MELNLNRRTFLKSGTAGVTAAFAGVSLPGFALSVENLATDYPIPTRAPESGVSALLKVVADKNVKDWNVSWEFAEDEYFEQLVNTGSVIYPDEQKNLSISLQNVPPGKKIYYRLNCERCTVIQENSVSVQTPLSDTTNLDLFPVKKFTYPESPEQSSQDPVLVRVF